MVSQHDFGIYLQRLGLVDPAYLATGGYGTLYVAKDAHNGGYWPASREQRRQGTVYALKVVSFADHRGVDPEDVRDTVTTEILALESLRGVVGVVTLHHAEWSASSPE